MRVALVGLTALWLTVFNTVAAQGFAITSVSPKLSDGVYYLNADIQFELNDAVREALENGVAVTVVFEAGVQRSRTWGWDQAIAELSARYSIEYYALSSRYVLRNLELGTSKSFRRLEGLLSELGAIRDFPLVDAKLFNPTDTYTVRVRARLDIESLPAPLRPLAYLSALWRLSTDWHEEPMTP